MNNPHTGWTAFLCGDHEGTAVGLLVKAGSSLAACALMILGRRLQPTSPPGRRHPGSHRRQRVPHRNLFTHRRRRAIQLGPCRRCSRLARGHMVVSYQDATNGPQAGRDLMQQSQFLEGLADSINQSMKLPNDIALKGAECGEENTRSELGRSSITMCYEYADWALKTFTNLGDPDPAASARGLLMATFYHETGHMASSIYDLPTTGRGGRRRSGRRVHPVATGRRRRVDQDAKDAVMNYARGFQQDSEDQGPDVPDWLFADPHTPGQGPDVQLRSAGSGR